MPPKRRGPSGNDKNLLGSLDAIANCIRERPGGLEELLRNNAALLGLEWTNPLQLSASDILEIIERIKMDYVRLTSSPQR